MDDLEREIAELKNRLSELEAKQAEREEKPFVPDEELNEKLRNYNPLDGVGMPGPAMKPMVDLVQDQKGLKFDRNAWARNRYPQPGGFGSPQDGPVREPEVQRGSGWRSQAPLEPQIKGNNWSK